MLQNWVEFLSIGTNFSILVVGIKLIRHLSRIELKVEVMWKVFMDKFGGSE